MTLAREFQRIYISPPCADVLESLSTGRLVVRDEGDGGQRVGRVAEPLSQQYSRFGDPSCLAGLEEALIALLLLHGYRVHREIASDTVPRGLPDPDLAAARNAGAIDRAFLDFVRNRERGVIAIDGAQVDPVTLIAQVALAFPTASIAVVGTRLVDVIPLAKKLGRIVPGGARWASADSWLADYARVLVATPFGLGHNPVRLWERDILIALDATEAVGVKPSHAIEHAGRARLFALRPLGRRIAPYDRDRIAALFGFDELAIPRHGFVEREVAAFTARIAGGPPLAPTLEGPALKREGLWHHPVRNRRIARLARDLATGNHAGLAATQPALHAALEGRAAPKAAVLVEGLEHALELARLLPGWMIVTGPDVVTAGLTARQVALLGRGRPPAVALPSRAIVTMAGLGAIDRGALDVLVRGDGGVGALPGLTSIPVPAESLAGPLLVVDCDDRHHPELRRRTRHRREWYAGRGWAVDGEPAPTALDRFLATRPGVKP